MQPAGPQGQLPSQAPLPQAEQESGARHEKNIPLFSLSNMNLSSKLSSKNQPYQVIRGQRSRLQLPDVMESLQTFSKFSFSTIEWVMTQQSKICNTIIMYKQILIQQFVKVCFPPFCMLTAWYPSTLNEGCDSTNGEITPKQVSFLQVLY